MAERCSEWSVLRSRLTSAALCLLIGTTAANAAGLNGVAGTQTSAVAVGDGRILFSNNLHLSWFESTGANPAVDYTAVTSTPSGYVAVASNGSVWTSSAPTGTAFSVRDTPSARALRAIRVVGSRLLAVGDNGTILRSNGLDGSGWVSQATTVTATLRAIATNATTTVIVGDGGTILRGGADGASFVRVEVDETRDLLGICVNAENRTFLAVGRDGAMLRANADALTWTPIDGGTSATLRACTTNNLPYGLGTVVVGDGGTVLFSAGNFSNWTEANSGTIENLYALAFTSVDFIAVGENRATLKSVSGFAGWEIGVVPIQATTWGGLKELFRTRR